MPCYDERSSGAYRAKELQQKLDAVTRAACDLRTILRRGGTEDDLCAETREWIAAHDDWDRRRIEQEQRDGIREATRNRGLEKLTLDERRALGL